MFVADLDARRGWTAYSTVRKWTLKLDLFDKDYVVVPINEQ